MEHIGKLIPLATVQANSVQVRQETKPVGSTEDEQKLSLAVQGVKISHYSEDEIKQVLRFAFHLVGLRAQNYPEGEDKIFLHAYIKENYGGHTGAEIRLAFTMAIQGRLGIEESDVTCYENFSVAYLTRIMNAYRHWSEQAAKHVLKEDVKQKIYTTTDNDNQARKTTEECYQRFLRGDMKLFPTAVMYPILVQDKVILPDSDVKIFFEDRKQKGMPAIYERY